MLKEMQNPTAFISRVRASWSRSASSLEKNFTSPFFWRHTTETMSWQSFSDSPPSIAFILAYRETAMHASTLALLRPSGRN